MPKELTLDDIVQLGTAIGKGISAAQGGNTRDLNMAFKESTITQGTPNIYGRYTIFDPCSPGDVFGLQVQTHGLMQWLGFRPNRYYRRHVDFITYWAASGTAAGQASDGAGAPCSDPNGWEYGHCGYDLCHYSWYHREGDGLTPHTVVQDRCETTPRYRLNGMAINDDVEWQMNGIMNVLSQDIKYGLIHGSHSNAYEMNGLESLVKTGYTDRDGRPCEMVDSIVVDWNGDNLDGDVNGYGNWFDYLDATITEMEYRASPIGVIPQTDMVLLTSRFMATCILDSYACYTTCGVTSTGDVTDQALRAQQRTERNRLNGGALYDGTTAVGFINLKSGRNMPILVDDSIDIGYEGGNYTSDIYVLTRRVGSMDVFYGMYLDMREYENRVRKYARQLKIQTDPTGRFAFKHKEDNFCIKLLMGTSPELYLSAPFLQARFQDVGCAFARKPVSGAPEQTDYLPGTLYSADYYDGTSC